MTHLHNFTAWILLVILAVSVILFLLNHIGKKPLHPFQDKLRLIAVIVSGIQLIVGFILYFNVGYYKALGEMANKAARFNALEHPLTMLIGIVLIHIGSGQIKKAADNKKNLKGLIFFGLSLVLIVSRIPWEKFV